MAKFLWTPQKIAKAYKNGVPVAELMRRSGKNYTEVQAAIRKYADNSGVSPAARNAKR